MFTYLCREINVEILTHKDPFATELFTKQQNFRLVLIEDICRQQIKCE